MNKVKLFLVLGLLVGSMTFAGCCGFDPCDPLPNPCCDDPCADPCGTPAPAPAAAPADAAPAAGNSCGGGKSCG